MNTSKCISHSSVRHELKIVNVKVWPSICTDNHLKYDVAELTSFSLKIKKLQRMLRASFSVKVYVAKVS